MQEKYRCLDETFLHRAGITSNIHVGPPGAALPVLSTSNSGIYSCYPSVTVISQDPHINSLQVSCNTDIVHCNGYTNAYSTHSSSQAFLPAAPFLTIVEQPISRIRFRYKSEKGSHGGLTGRSSSLSKTYPTVKLEEYHYTNREVRIKASLYTCEDSPRRHVHKLMGRDCDDRGVCTVSLRDDMTAVFQNLGVLFTGKKEVPEILYQRKLEERHVTPYGCNTEEDLKELREEAEHEAKNLNLNCIKICFEAFNFNPETNVCGVPICEKIFSDSIANQKSPDSGELKIVKMDKYSGFCTGNEEVFLLCEKVNKKEIKVRFYETNAEGKLLWESFGSFSEADVHHQVAIVFRTPPYKNIEIDNPVTVCVQLFRKKDGEGSEPKSFVYKPVLQDEEGLDRKRKKMIHHSFSEGYSTNHGCFGTPGFISVGREGTEFGVNYFGGHCQNPPTHQHKLTYSEIDEFETSTEQGYSLNEGAESEWSCPSSGSPDHTAVLLHADPLLSATNENCLSPNGINGSQFLSSIVNDGVRNNSNSEHDLTNFIQFKSLKIKEELSCDACVNQRKTVHLLSAEPLTLKSPFTSSVDSVSEKSAQEILKTVTQEDGQMTCIPHLCDSVQFSEKISQTEKPETFTNKIKKYSYCPEIIRNKIAMHSLHALRHFVVSANITPLLLTIRQLIAVEDEDGDNILHLAVLHQHLNTPLMSSLLEAAKELPYDVVNHTNHVRQTPLHLATLSNSPQIIKTLLMHHANPMLQDRNGNTAFHLATKYKYSECLSELLDNNNYCLPIRNFNKSHSKSTFFNLNTLNYEGYSAIHLGVFEKSTHCIHLLCAAGANINLIDGTSGRTALHLAVEHNQDIVTFLLSYPSLDVNAQDFAGNTPLHLACGKNLFNTVAKLIQANASPSVENYDRCISEFDSLHLPHGVKQGKTPMDLVINNKDIAALLSRKYPVPPNRSLDSNADIETEHKSDILDKDKNDSGYHSGQIHFIDDDTLKKLCYLMDPPSSDWEKLGNFLGLEQEVLDNIRKLQSTFTHAVLKYFESTCKLSEEEKLVCLKNALDMAGLLDGLHVLLHAQLLR